MGSINIVHLVSGEQVITKLTEMRDKDGEPFCFLFQMPMVLSLVPGETEDQTQINFFPWSPFSGSREFRVGFEKTGKQIFGGKCPNRIFGGNRSYFTGVLF